MATTMTLTELLAAVRQRADIVNSQFITDPELTSYINQSYFELYDILVQKYGDNYYVSSATITTDGTNDKYSLPTDFLKLLGVDLVLATDANVTLRQFNMSDRNRFTAPNFQSFYGVTNLRYRLHGNQLWLTPKPSSGQTLTVFYVPRMTPLVNGADTVDGVSGWTEYIILDAVIKCKLKGECDASSEMALKAAIIKRIEDAAEDRDAGSSSTVGDTQWHEGWWPAPGGYGGGGLS